MNNHILGNTLAIMLKIGDDSFSAFSIIAGLGQVGLDVEGNRWCCVCGQIVV